MAGRIRTIKPDVLAEARIAGLTDGAYRLFIGLYSLADDLGNCPAGPTYLSGQIFYLQRRSAIAIGKLLSELQTARLIDRYVADGAPYLKIVGWTEKGAPTYQRIDKPQPPRFPVPRSVRSWNGFDAGSDPIRSDQGTEWSGSGRPAAHTHTLLSLLWKPSDSEANQEAASEARARGVDVEDQLARLHDWALARKKTSADWDAHWRNWLRGSKPTEADTRPIAQRAMDRARAAEAREKARRSVGRMEPLHPNQYAAGEQDLSDWDPAPPDPTKLNLVADPEYNLIADAEYTERPTHD